MLLRASMPLTVATPLASRQADPDLLVLSAAALTLADSLTKGFSCNSLGDGPSGRGTTISGCTQCCYPHLPCPMHRGDIHREWSDAERAQWPPCPSCDGSLEPMCVRYGADKMCRAYLHVHEPRLFAPVSPRFETWVFPPITRVCENYIACVRHHQGRAVRRGADERAWSWS